MPKLTGRRPLDFIRRYFEFNSNTNYSMCNILVKNPKTGKEKQCGTLLKGQHSGKLEKHIVNIHPESVASINITAERIRRAQLKKKINSDETETEMFSREDMMSSFTSSSSSLSLPQMSQSIEQHQDISRKKRIRVSKISITMTAKTLRAACVELTTTNGRPFTLLEDSGMKMILDPIIATLKEQAPLTLNRKIVRTWVIEEAAKLRDKIRKEVTGKMICLKFDTATRLDRSVIGINIQFCQENRLILRCLCVKQLHKRHTSENLKIEILQVLLSYGILPRQIYAVTTDNATNVVRTVTLLGKEVMNRIHDCDSEENEDDSDSSCDEDNYTDNNCAKFSDIDIVTNSEDNIPNIDKKNDSTPYIKYFEWPQQVEDVKNSLMEQGIMGTRCAAHTLQLAVWDALRSPQVVTLIDKIRIVCRALRSPIASEYLRALNLTKPSLDNETRWHSTEDMILSLLRLKDVCHEAMKHCKKKIDLSDAEWEAATEISDVLLPAKIATKQLQSEQLTVGDFFAIWLRCKLDTASKASGLAQEIAAAMERREKRLLDSDAIVAAIYMDPRYQVLLSEEHHRKAQNHLLLLWYRMQDVKNSPESCSYSGSEHDADNETDVLDIDDDPLEKLLKQQEKNKNYIAQPKRSKHIISIERLLRDFSGISRLKQSENILQYWETRCDSPELRELAFVALSLPMTQVSVERVFSNLKYVLSVLRGNLDSCVTDDILVMRCNNLFMRQE